MLVVINFIALLITNYHCWKARELPSEYKESSFVICTNVILLEAFLLAFPILFMVKDDPSARLTVNTVLVCIVSWAVLLPVLGQLFRKPKAVPQFRFGRNTGVGGGVGVVGQVEDEKSDSTGIQQEIVSISTSKTRTTKAEVRLRHHHY